MIAAARQIKVNKAIQIQCAGDFRGVGYHTQFRRDVAETVRQGIRADNAYLDDETNEFVLGLLDAGLTRSTLSRWLDKYAKFNGTFFIKYRK